MGQGGDAVFLPVERRYVESAAGLLEDFSDYTTSRLGDLRCSNQTDLEVQLRTQEAEMAHFAASRC